MLSEDTGTQGTGNFELELGYDWGRQDGQRNFLFQPQLSWGVSPSVDLIVQPSWIVQQASTGPRTRGLGLPHDRFSSHAILVASSARTTNRPVSLVGCRDLRLQQPLVLHHRRIGRFHSNPDRTQTNHAAVALAGVIFTARPGLDIDVGFRGRLGAIGPVQQWLFRLTYRGAP